MNYVCNFKMGGNHVSSFKYINVLLFYSVEIQDTKYLECMVYITIRFTL